MKKIRLLFIGLTILSLLAVYSCKEKPKTEDSESTTEETAEDQEVESADDAFIVHVCNEKCVAGGCFYKHGEKGHVCGEDCGAMKETSEKTTSDEALVEHVCNDKCAGGNCFFKHGEKGHVCTEDCKSTKEAEE